MIDLLNVPDPDKKIDIIVNEAISDKENEIKEATKMLDNLKQQEKEGRYYTPIDTNPDSTLKYVATSVFSILGDVLQGFQKATEHIKNKATEARSNQNEQQLGGNNTTIDNNDHEANEVIKQAEHLLKMIGGANEQIKAGTIANTNTGANTGANNNETASQLSSLGDTASDYAGEIFSKAKDLTVVGLKTGIQWYGNTLSKLIDMGMEMTGEKKILDTPIDQLSPDLNKKILSLEKSEYRVPEKRFYLSVLKLLAYTHASRLQKLHCSEALS